MIRHLLWEYGLKAWIALCLAGLVLIAGICIADLHREHKHGERM